MKKSIAVVCLVAMCACATPGLEIQTRAVTADVKSSVPNEQIGQYTNHTVRSYISVEGTQTEIAGASCTISSNELSVRVITPANVAMPSFIQRENFPARGKPSPLAMTCTAEGVDGSTVVSADNIGRGRPGSTSDATMVRSPIGGGQAGSAPWGYPALIKIDMN